MNELERCFRIGQLRKVEPSSSKSQISIKEAYKWLKESLKNKDSKAYSSATLTIYLIFFHAARSVLFRDGVREKSHYCIVIYLEAYQKEGLLEENWVLLFDRMRSARHAGQYSFLVEPSIEELENGIESAKNFIKRIEKLLSTTKPLLLNRKNDV